MLTSSPKFTSQVLDGCWVGSDTISVATADGCIHTMSAVSKRLSEKKMEGNSYILSNMITLNLLKPVPHQPYNCLVVQFYLRQQVL